MRENGLERVRIAQPGGQSAAAATERTVLDWGMIKIKDRTRR